MPPNLRAGKATAARQMPCEIKIETCAQDQVGLLQQFINRYWRAGHILARDAALLRWQHDQTRSPVRPGDGPTILLAWQGGRLVGMLGLIYFDLNLLGECIPGAWLTTWFGLPEVRNQLVGLKLLQAAHDTGFAATGTVGMNEAVRTIYRGLGYDLLDDMPRWVAVFDTATTTRLLQAVGDAAAAPPADSADSSAEGSAVETIVDLHRAQTPQTADRPFQDRETTPVGNRCHKDHGMSPEAAHAVEVAAWSGRLGPQWDECWRTSFAPRLVGPSRDAAYLNWRYVEHPVFTYHVLAARMRGADTLSGLAVYRIEQVLGRPEKVMRVVEFLATPTAGAALAAEVARAAVTHGVCFADFYCTNREMAAGLEQVGFRRTASDDAAPAFPTRFQPLEPGRFQLGAALRLTPALRREHRALLGSAPMYLTKSDCDMDRPN